MKQSRPLVVAAAGAVAFLLAWLGMATLTGEPWQDVLPVALAGAVVFGVVNFSLRLWWERRNAG